MSSSTLEDKRQQKHSGRHGQTAAAALDAAVRSPAASAKNALSSNPQAQPIVDPVARQQVITAEALAEIGLVLRQTREQRGLGLGDVAQQLNIFERHLSRIERGELPDVALTFARGYLKNYAGFLGLDSEFLVANFNRVLDEQEQAETALSENAEVASKTCGSSGGDNNSKSNGTNRLIKLTRKLVSKFASGFARAQQIVSLAYQNGSSWSNGGFRSPVNFLHAATSAALPLLLLSVVAFTYHSIDAERIESEEVAIASLALQTLRPEKLGPLASEALGSDSKPSSYPTPALADAATAKAPEKAASPETEPTAVAMPSELVAANSASPANRTNSAQPAITSQIRASGVITVGQASQRASERNTVPGESIEDSFEPVGPGAVEMISQVQQADRLVITVYEDSWIDVRDNSGARLYRNLARAGRRIDVSGELPFALHVGNVPGLEMRLNGEPVEITRYRSDNSARLTLASAH